MEVEKVQVHFGMRGKKGRGELPCRLAADDGVAERGVGLHDGWMDESEEGTEFISDRLRGDRDRIFFYSNCTGTPYRRCAGFLSIRFRLHAEVLYATYNASMVYGIICMRLLSNKRQGD